MQRITREKTGYAAGMQIGDDQAVLMEMLVTAVRSLNDAIVADPRVKVVLIPVGDGVSFVQKLGERQ